MRCRQLISILGLVVPWSPVKDAGTGPCEKHQKPFQIPADSLTAMVHTIALRPTRAYVDLSDSALGRAALLDSILGQVLRAAQFNLAEVSVVDSIWRATRDSTGGLYDPNSGQLDTAKAHAADETFRRTLGDSLKVDAVLYPGLYTVGAKFDNGTAQWDGAKQGFANFGKRFLEALGGGPYSGQTSALSLRTFMVAIDGRPLYDNRGGIQVLAVPKNGKFVTVPEESVLSDSTRLARAVSIAVCQLVRQR